MLEIFMFVLLGSSGIALLTLLISAIGDRDLSDSSRSTLWAIFIVAGIAGFYLLLTTGYY